jgi:toxin ParE1/3/4
LKRPYRLTPTADRDVDEHFIYLAKRSGDAGVRFLRAADATFEQLAAMPELGQRQDFGGDRLVGVRAWQIRGFENYLVFYRPIQGGVEIIRVLHAARDVPTVFEDQA